MKQPSSQAFVLQGSSYLQGPLVLTCEHATRFIPEPLVATQADQEWLIQHWGWDPGIEDVTSYLVEEMRSVGVFSRFSRLICDPNRGYTEASWIVTEVEGYKLSFNQALTQEERARRKRELYDPYHQAISDIVQQRLQHDQSFTFLSMHSFTPVYLGQKRKVEIGVLHDEVHEADAKRLALEIEKEGFCVELNEPYSGMNGMIYAAHRHGQKHDVRYMELEIRQDLIDTQGKAHTVGSNLVSALQRWLG